MPRLHRIVGSLSGEVTTGVAAGAGAFFSKGGGADFGWDEHPVNANATAIAIAYTRRILKVFIFSPFWVN